MGITNVPNQRVIFKFTPLEKFSDIRIDEDGDPHIVSKYLPEFSYSVREGNTQLAEKVKRWIEEGKVRMGD